MNKGRSPSFFRNWCAIFCGGAGSQIMYVFMYNYALIFFTDVLGIAAGVAGTIFTLSRVWDAINDPICGTLIDKTETRFGKTQPWMLCGGVISAVALVLLFTVPDMGIIGKEIWGTVFYNVMGMAFTAVTVSTLVQTPRASRLGGERVYLSASYSIACAVSGILVAAGIIRGLAAFAEKDPAGGYQKVALICAAAGLFFLLGNVFLFRDQESANEQKLKDAGMKMEKAKVKDMIGAVLKTPPFLILVLIFVIFCLGTGINSGAMIYYFNYTLEKPQWMQAMLPLLYVGTFTASLTMGYLARFGKVRMCRISFALYGICFAVRGILGDISLAMTAVLFVLGNLGAGYAVGYLNPMLMDCADYAEHRTGVNCQALTLSGFTLCSKMAAGLGTAVLGFVLQTAGYVGTALVQPESALNAIRIMHLWVPVIFSALSFVLLSLYKLDDKTMEQLRREKTEREQAELAAVNR